MADMPVNDGESSSTSSCRDLSSQLKPIFEAFDMDHTGAISVDTFSRLVKEHFGASDDFDISEIIKYLDPTTHGSITFDKFVQGIQKIFADQGTSITDFMHLQPSSSLVDAAKEEERTTESSLGHEQRRALFDLSLDDDRDSSISARSLPEIRAHHVPSDTDDYDPLEFGSEVDANDSASVVGLSSQLRGSHHGDDILEDIDDNFLHLSDKVTRMESMLLSLSHGQLRSDDTHRLLRHENSQLLGKVAHMEDQLREVEVSSKRQSLQEAQRIKELLVRQDRDRLREIENLQQRIRDAEKQLSATREEVPVIKAEIQLLKDDKERHVNEHSAQKQKLELTHRQLTELNQSTAREQHSALQQKRQMDKLADELGREYRELQRQQESEVALSKAKSASEAEGLLYAQLQAERDRLKQEIESLNSGEDELQAQLLARSLQEGRCLLQRTESMGPSLASELKQCTKDEIAGKLQDQQEQNRMLQDYLDRLVANIMEVNPAMLEVKSTSTCR